jgi:hypothetical protein
LSTIGKRSNESRSLILFYMHFKYQVVRNYISSQRNMDAAVNPILLIGGVSEERRVDIVPQLLLLQQNCGGLQQAPSSRIPLLLLYYNIINILFTSAPTSALRAAATRFRGDNIKFPYIIVSSSSSSPRCVAQHFRNGSIIRK